MAVSPLRQQLRRQVRMPTAETNFSSAGRNLLPLSIVNNPHVASAVPIIGNLAYLSLASGFVCTDMLMLRTMLIGGYSGLVAFHCLHPKPLRIPLLYSAIFVAVNAAMALQLAHERWPGLTEDEQLLHSAFFHRMTPKQFKRLLELGEHVTLRDGATVTMQQQHCDRLYFIERGITNLSVNGERVAEIGRGGFVNDVAFVQGDKSGSYGTCVTNGECRVISWDVAKLRAALAADAILADVMKHVFMGIQIEQLLQRYKISEEKLQRKRQQAMDKTRTGSRLSALATLRTGERYREGLEEARKRGARLASKDSEW